MPKKINPLERKVPMNLSIRNVVVMNFDKFCNDLEIDRNTFIESMLVEVLHENKFNKDE